MFDCNNLVHPFQNDTGCSQSQRVMDDLLTSTTKIDGRTLADLLNYFSGLSSHIKYYNSNLAESDWQDFFKDSLPFVIAAATRDNSVTIKEKFESYNQLCSKSPSDKGLQLLIHFLYYRTIFKINKLYGFVKNSGLPVFGTLEQTIKNKLRDPVLEFIKVSYTAYDLFDIKRINFASLFPNEIWQINNKDVVNGDEAIKAITGRDQQIIAIQNKVSGSFSALLPSIDIIAAAAGTSLQQSLLPLKDELKQKHPPHLALLFTFLDLFEKLQNDLNGYSKKHLDFFYQDVLQLKAKDAQPDKAHVIFELQKELKQYVLKKGLLAKADKDIKGAEIDFELNDDIVVNKTRISDLRTLFINYKKAGNYTYAEGLYMATKANTADGIAIDFKDDPKNFPTLGAKFSKYTAPGNVSPKPYPAARVGFVLASPVLLLNEGERTIEITLTCSLNDSLNDICEQVAKNFAPSGDICCPKENSGPDKKLLIDDGNSPAKGLDNDIKFIETSKLLNLDDFKTLLNGTFVLINTQLIDQARKKGLSEDKATLIRDAYLKVKPGDHQNDDCPKSICCSEDVTVYSDDRITDWLEWKGFVQGKTTPPGAPATQEPVLTFTIGEQNFLFEIFKPFKPLTVLLSGEKDWIDPLDDINKLSNTSTTNTPADSLDITITGDAGALTLSIRIVVAITADKPPVTFYNKEVLKEDLGTTQPLVKIELNDIKKLALVKNLYDDPDDPECCLQTKDILCRKFISLYHFFRNVAVTNTNIKVTVCGLKKNIIVQNDESVQDVNSPIYPFGVRPQKEANFYIGSKEIFYKKWDSVQVNHNWKSMPEKTTDDPSEGPFEEYYKGYQHMYINPEDINDRKIENVIKDNNFKAAFAVRSNGSWYNDPEFACNLDNDDANNLLFEPATGTGNICNPADDNFKFAFRLPKEKFSGLPYRQITEENELTKLNADTRNGFLRITLKCQDFQHGNYPFVLARQMMAFGRLPTDLVTGAFYRDNPAETVLVFNDIGLQSDETDKSIEDLQGKATDTKTKTGITLKLASPDSPSVKKRSLEQETPILQAATNADTAADDTVKAGKKVGDAFGEYKENIPILSSKSKNKNKLEAVIPKEPWTPIISNMSLDYTATAEKTDVTLIHLYPYKDTYKQEQLTLDPALFPSFCDEGTLFIGLSDLVPGSNINMLFQLAEATSDSEADTQVVYWQYLYANQWFNLRKGFEVLDDDTNNLTGSGVIKFALPENMNTDNTVMPKGLYWIKASVPINSKAVCETIAIYTQAVKATFVVGEANDTGRLLGALKAGSISKLKTADANVKSVTQPDASFGGQPPELTNLYYTRVSELLRHKGRAIQKFDYERLILQAFPQVYKVKCISHSFKLDADSYTNDFPMAPGYVLIVVIPDLTKLQAGQSFEPKLSTGIIEKIQTYLGTRTSPFVKIKVVNPRYEKVNFCLSVILNKGYDKIYYKEKLTQDLRNFLAPWAIGEFDKLRFGQCINKSDVVQFLETREYVDYITGMLIQDEFYGNTPSTDLTEICPHTPRSILLAGEIQVCIEEEDAHDFTGDPCNIAKPVMDYCKDVKTILV